MPYIYNEIVHHFFEEIKPLFINYLRKNFNIDYDEIMGIYTETWIDVRENIISQRVEEHTNWRAYILRIGWNKANKFVSRRPVIISTEDDKFDRAEFENAYKKEYEQVESIYNDPALKAVLGAELSYIPNPCNKILNLYYFDHFSMHQIADMMNYSSYRSANVMKNRCFEKLKTRVLNAVKHLGILEN